MEKKITVYSTGCPQCHVLESKLKAKNLEFEIVSDIDEMQKLGIVSVPQMKVGDGNLMLFSEAVEYVNSL